jgi:hypothetical protein
MPMFAQFMRRNRYKITIFALMTLASGVCIALVAGGSPSAIPAATRVWLTPELAVSPFS